MQSVILSIHIILAFAITALVLLQRSEGGALGGLGGSQGANSLFTGRQAGNLLTKLTSIFFACFVCTSLYLVVAANKSRAEAADEVILDVTETPTEQEAPAEQE